ncbi:GxxExxY protein [Lewinella sp. IMCC34183]|uniref:GxxExxY protein n=1 Tax=Lewinella sp. IMCC34183 TaxID=2248762 RepID=UPI000E27BD27|nr:GxxExxY protein [Lewinella sp. IMCC34183]
MKSLNEISYAVIGAAIRVHSALGPGLLESTYEKCLMIELNQAGLTVERQRSLPLRYKGTLIENAYRIDILVEGQLIIELKAIERLTPLDTAQLLTYLKLSGLNLGLLLNFNATKMTAGIKRVINSATDFRMTG